ncbi:MAG: ABC transporter substrate-binding protein [Anaerolineae bacterium]
MKSRLSLLLLLIVSSLSLAVPAFAQDRNTTAECVTTYDANTDYFPDKVTVEAAAGFSVEYHNNYKVVTVNTPWQGAEAPLTYVLVQCGTPAPEMESTATIEVPVNTVVSMSTSFLPHLTAQGLLDKVVAVDSMLYTNNEVLQARFAADAVVEVGGGGGGTEVNIEKLIDLQPGLILTQRFSADDTTYPTIQEAGLPVVIDADFLDVSPLGLAEWGKFISLFFNTEALAQEQFAGVQARYEELATLAKTADSLPTVFAGTPFDSTWFMPGGASYLGTLIRDAGGNYLWGDDESTGSLFLDMETVLDTAADADYWVNIFQTSKSEVLGLDERLRQFAAFENNAYTNNARMNANGGSDYFENGYANPDVLLADLVKIFHPNLLPDHELVYYAKLAAG